MDGKSPANAGIRKEDLVVRDWGEGENLETSSPLDLPMAFLQLGPKQELEGLGSRPRNQLDRA